GREHGDAWAVRRKRPAFDNAVIFGIDGNVHVVRMKPAWPQVDAVHWNAAEEEQGSDPRPKPQVMAFETGVIGQDFARRKTKGRRAQRMRRPAKEHRSKRDAFRAQVLLQAPVLGPPGTGG